MNQKEIKDRIKKTKEAARARVVKDGTIQFRIDAENMERLLKAADTCKTGAGVLARMWVIEHLNSMNQLHSEQSKLVSNCDLMAAVTNSLAAQQRLAEAVTEQSISYKRTLEVFEQTQSNLDALTKWRQELEHFIQPASLFQEQIKIMQEQMQGIISAYKQVEHITEHQKKLEKSVGSMLEEQKRQMEPFKQMQDQLQQIVKALPKAG